MKIHWLKTLVAKKRKETFCGNRNWKSLSSDSDNVSCKACVRTMIMTLGYAGNEASKTWAFTKSASKRTVLKRG